MQISMSNMENTLNKQHIRLQKKISVAQQHRRIEQQQKLYNMKKRTKTENFEKSIIEIVGNLDATTNALSLGGDKWIVNVAKFLYYI